MTAAVGEGVARRGGGRGDKPVLVCMMTEDADRSSAAAEPGEDPLLRLPRSGGPRPGKVAAYADWRAQPPGVVPDFDDLDLAGGSSRLSASAGRNEAAAGSRPRKPSAC